MKYALIIGNNQYYDPTLAQLKTPAADAQVLGEVLKDQRIGSFDEVIPLVNKTEFQVSRAISAFLTNKKPEDLVLVYFSGHGVLDDRGRLFLALKDTQTSLLKSTAISSSFIADEMDSCRSKRQILILDCCHSGAFGRGVKGGEQKAVTETTFEGSGFGRVILTASDSTQYALEGDQVIKQTELSLFTHFLLEGLQTGKADINNDGHISLDEWYDYAYSQVLATTPKQVPHKWSYHQQGDLIIAKNLFAKKKIAELPAELVRLLERPYSSVREVAVKELGVLLRSRDPELAEWARQTLEKLKNDDSRTVSLAIENILLEADAKKGRQKEVEHKTAPKSTLSKALPLLKTAGMVGVIIILFWAGSWVMPKFFSLVPTAKVSETAPPAATIALTKASTPALLTPEITLTPFVFNDPYPDSSDYVDARGIPMRLVPAGDFTMGSDNGDPDETPIHTIGLSAFYIDKYEVTNALYTVCVNAGACQQPRGVGSYTRSSYYGNLEFDSYPVIYVEWDMAKVYCEWRSAQLPTDAQWEKAARGTDGRTYPWGNEFDGNRLNFCDKNCDFDGANKDYDDGHKDTAPVGSYESGQSPYGIYDMAGNVWEWVADWYSSTHQSHAIRGGSWVNSDYDVRSAERGLFESGDFYYIGFRCAKDVNP